MGGIYGIFLESLNSGFLSLANPVYAEFRSFHPTFQQLQGPALEQHVNMLPNSCRKIDQLPIKIVAACRLAGKSQVNQYFYTSLQ
jgi:hypothetical protein